ncbi:phosphatidylinositol-3,5-bisphosphate 5-phosphatase [Chytriomyces hyalinus]|nr:phosphatidylinositol-3,5-bisphosphate 5-phosphatase [Chytriomyces hyalinus]
MTVTNNNRVRVTVIVCDTPAPQILSTEGNYANMFERLMRRAAALSSGSQPASEVLTPKLSSLTVFILLNSSALHMGWLQNVSLEFSAVDVAGGEALPTSEEQLDAIDAIIITGSKHGVNDALEWIEPLQQFVRMAAATNRIKVVGVCFGHQIIAAAFGGKVSLNEHGWEVGYTEMQVTPEGKQFLPLQQNTECLRFYSMHKDIVSVCPPGFSNLFSTTICPYQSLVNEKRTVLTIQSHPEYSRSTVCEITKMRRGLGIFEDAFADKVESFLKDEYEVDSEWFSRVIKLTLLTLYETRARFFMVGSTQDEDTFRILKINRSPDPETGALCVSDGRNYGRQEMLDVLAMIESGNAATGGMKRVASCFGIVGFVSFLEGHYMILVTKRSAVALIGGHYVYHIDDTMILGLSGSNDRFDKRQSSDEARYIQSFCQVDLSKNFYLSYTYDITNSLQNNMTRSKSTGFNEMFVWNHFLLKNGFDNFDSEWCLPIIYGFVDQAKIPVFGHDIYLTLIARRSRFFAGARFLKRGVNDNGFVANEVETEQIVFDAKTTLFGFPKNGNPGISNPSFTSFLQHRGSIPLYWSQEISQLTPKPPIELNLSDPYYTSTSLHFANLIERYGNPIIVLNLIKSKEKTPRESLLLLEFSNSIEYLNSHLPDDIPKMQYIEWDMARASKSDNAMEVTDTLEEIAEEGIHETGFFHAGREPYANSVRRAEEDASTPIRILGRRQSGIIRTNCIDCLDRTNAAQFMIGKSALGHQLYALGVLSNPYVQFDSDACNLLNGMYQDHGDTIALQYGGSHLVNTMETYRKIGHWTSHSRDMIESIRRYYSNSFTDAEKQDAINLFLGNFIVSSRGPMIWDLPSDYYLHHNPDPLPKARKRSYKAWWINPETAVSDSHDTESAESKESSANLMDVQDFFAEYYRPSALTSFDRLYVCNMNPASSAAAAAAGFEGVPGSSYRDPSPFAVRNLSGVSSGTDSEKAKVKNPHGYGACGGLIVVNLKNGGIEEWVRPADKHTSKAKTEESDEAGDQLSEEKTAPWWTTKALSMRLLDPQVPVSELREYKRYISQFRPQLVLSMRIPSIHLDAKRSDPVKHPDFELYQTYVSSSDSDASKPLKTLINSRDEEIYSFYATQSGKIGNYVGGGNMSSGIDGRNETEDSRYEAYARWLSNGQYT